MNTLAEKFRLKRKELRLSQQTLAEGICEQSQISKIERGHFIPSADLLFKLSQRLEVPIEARELCKIYNNPLMLMKIENYLKELDTV